MEVPVDTLVVLHVVHVEKPSSSSWVEPEPEVVVAEPEVLKDPAKAPSLVSPVAETTASASRPNRWALESMEYLKVTTVH